MATVAQKPFAGSTFGQLPPLAKLGLWLLSVAASAGVIQVAAWSVGSDFSILSKSGGSAVLISLALFFLLVLMAVDRRPVADYGLVADEQWMRHGFGGFLLGVAVYGGYCVAAWALGVLMLQPEEVTSYRCVKAAVAGLSAAPVAVTQQIIFAGYLLSTLRERHGRTVAVVLPAVLFAAVSCLSKFDGSVTPEIARLAIGLFLVAAVLGVLRLRMGNIALSAGVLAGCVFVRKVLGKTRLLAYDGSEPWAAWIAPHGDPRQALAFWTLLVVGLVVGAWALARYGERQSERSQGALDASFKRIMPFSNLLALAPLDHWLVLLAAARFRIGWKYLPRLLVTLIASTFNTLMSLPERILAPVLLRHRVPDPVIIVGMPRSGTTHLHNLLSLDPQFRSPRNYEVFNPLGFLTGWLTTAIMAPFLTWRRPMDAVQMQVFSPQEEEFALAGMGHTSPYWSFEFPRCPDQYDGYWLTAGFSRREVRQWQRRYRLFLRKLTLFARRRPLLKNPANTGRVAMVKQTFPGAKFIHIYRHPYAVYRSNQHLAREGLVVFQLQDPDPQHNYATRALPRHRALMDAFYRDAATLAEGDVAEMQFERLETNPIEEIERLYRQLGLEMSDVFRGRLVRYLERVAGYQKNRFAKLEVAQRQAVDAAMEPYFAQWGYPMEPSSPRADERHAA